MLYRIIVLLSNINYIQDNNVERAADWIFNHPDDLDTPMETDQPEGANQGSAALRDGSSSMCTILFVFDIIYNGPRSRNQN